MPKRKREDEEHDQIGQIEDRAIRIKASRLKAKIEQSNKVLKDAIQLARGFERQKLSRRQKQASEKPHTLLRLREEVIVVKELDPTKTAKDYLFKQLVKTKRIKESPAFVALFGDDPKLEPPKSVAEGNVLGRLFKSNPVKEVLPDILQSIKDILAIDKMAQSTGPATVVDQKDGLDVEELTGFSDNDQTVATRERDHLLEGIVIDDTGDDGSEQDLAGYDDRLVAPSDGSLSDDGNSTRLPSSSPSVSDESDVRRRGAKLDKTAFLPSLSMGGYYSGSESDADDVDEASGTSQQRKNRRGQRARQLIAAKKYGQNAKHLIKERVKGASRDRNSGWDSRRGAVQKSSRGSRGGFDNGPTGANGDVVNTDRARDRQARTSTTNKADGPLHPSWEAARKKKIENKNASFAGKKIIFD